MNILLLDDRDRNNLPALRRRHRHVRQSHSVYTPFTCSFRYILPFDIAYSLVKPSLRSTLIRIKYS